MCSKMKLFVIVIASVALSVPLWSSRSQAEILSNNNTVTIGGHTSASISSGDVDLGSGPVTIETADARLASPDGAVFKIGQIGITVRFFGMSGLLKSITLPTTPSIIDEPAFASQLFYSVSDPLPITQLRAAEGDASATSIRVRATAIIKNTTGASHDAKLSVDVLTRTGD